MAKSTCKMENGLPNWTLKAFEKDIFVVAFATDKHKSYEEVHLKYPMDQESMRCYDVQRASVLLLVK